MSTKFKAEQIIVGPGDMTANTTSAIFRSGTTDPNSFPPTGTKDGDIYMRVNGASSDLLIQVNGAYVSLSNSPRISTLRDGAVSQQWGPTSLPVSSIKYLYVDYSINRNSTPNYQQGKLEILTDGTNATVIGFNINSIGTDVGLSFNAQVVGGNLQLLYTASALGQDATMKYVIKLWG